MILIISKNKIYNFPMYSPYLKSYIYRNRVGETTSQTLFESLDNANRQNYFLKHQLLNLIDENEKLKIELVNEKSSKFEKEFRMGYGKELLEQKKHVGKLYEWPRQMKKEKKYSYSREQKRLDYPSRYRSSEKQLKKETFIDQLSEKKIMGGGKSLENQNEEDMWRRKKTNDPYLLKQDKERKKKRTNEGTKNEEKKNEEKGQEIMFSNIIHNRQSKKKGEKKHFLSLMQKTHEHINRQSQIRDTNQKS